MPKKKPSAKKAVGRAKPKTALRAKTGQRAKTRTSKAQREEIKARRQKLQELREQAAKAQSAPGLSLGYEAHRRHAAERARDVSTRGREIGEIPPSAEPDLVEECRLNLRLFCESFLATWFTDPWSDDHLKTIATIEACAAEGGFFAVAMPRGFGKTRLTLAAALWAVLCGHRCYVLLIGANRPKARDMFDAIKIALENNARLIAAFPEVCFPIACLEGIPQRRLLHKGERVIIRFSQSVIALPNISGSPASEAVIQFAGLASGIRGTTYSCADGRAVRPDLIIADDPQTDKSAHSPKQTVDRENTIERTLLNLGGGKRPLAMLMAITVICKGDLSSSYLDRQKHPEFRGFTGKMLYGMPDKAAMKHWARYQELLEASLLAGGRGEPAHEYYVEHQTAMDAGAAAAWEHKFEDGEASAIEHAMKKFLRNRKAFMAEQQNDPEDEYEQTSKLTPAMLATKLNGLKRGMAPKTAQWATAHVDVHGRLLYWTVLAAAPDLAAAVIDYGSHPRQTIAYYAQATAPKPLADAHPNMDEDARILAGLQAVVEMLLGREWKREDGSTLRTGKILIDDHWGEKTELVDLFCRRHPQYFSVVLPAMGYFLGASSKPFSQYKAEPGALSGLHWRIPPPKSGSVERRVLVDVNWWKSKAATGLASALGSAGGIEIFGRDPQEHRLLFDHFCGEEPKTVKELSKGLHVDEWKIKPGKPDNHFWDNLVGCLVGASMLGAKPAALAPRAAGEKSKPENEDKKPRKAVSYL